MFNRRKETSMRIAGTAILAAVMLFAATALSRGQLGVIASAGLGFTSATALSTTPVTSAIAMDGDAGFYNRLTMIMTVVWGTSLEMIVKCEASPNGTTWAFIQRCTDEAVHNCGDRQWKWVPADGTVFALDFTANYKNIRCQFDDAADGNGTVLPIAIRGK